MKIQAKDLKIGQDVKFGNQWIKIEKLIYGKLKNGNEYVQVVGQIYPATIRSRCPAMRNRKIIAATCDYNKPKLNTWVTVR